MGQAYRLVRPQLTLADIVSVRSNNLLSLTTSPFGVTPERYENNPPIYVKKAVAWKGYKGLGLEGFKRQIKNLIGDVEARKLGDGLEKAVSISRACAGVRGTELWNGKLYPRKCIEQKRRAGKL